MLSYSWSTSIDEFAFDRVFHFARSHAVHRQLRAHAFTVVLLVHQLDPVDVVRRHPAVKVLTARVRVSRCRLDLKDTVVNQQQRNIKRPAPKVEDQDVPLALRPLVKPVRNRSSRRLVDDQYDVQPEISLVSFVACRCEALKYAGHVMTAILTSSSRTPPLSHASSSAPSKRSPA